MDTHHDVHCPISHHSIKAVRAVSDIIYDIVDGIFPPLWSIWSRAAEAVDPPIGVCSIWNYTIDPHH
ncbi:hypothetical protein M2345_001750 [Sphingobium sp. B8D3D]|nr:hypothetical protein [Sphingobium sp. B8D3D]MCW2415711.1 hypothetical protein [Sphingobium sp. B8D3A]